MLSSGEKDGAMSLLQLMDSENIVSLARTVTNNQISITSVDGAINAVVTYSMNGVELLKRRKLKRDLLFRYLVSVNVAVDPRAGKVQLAKTILEHWGTRNVDILDLMEIGEDFPQNQSNDQAAAAAPHNEANTGVFPPALNAPQPMPNLIQNTPQPLPNLVQDIPNGGRNHFTASQTLPGGGGESWIADFMNFEHSVQSTPQDEQMGLEFAKWFYQMLNACHPQGLPCTTQFGTQHFFPDCQLKVAVMNSKELEVHDGADAVCTKLIYLSQGELVLFNANVDSGGVMGFATPHGLKIFLVCGTLHKDGDVVGVFAQQFGLVRNPDRDFNWNIKFTNLKLIAGRPTGLPTLQSPGNMLPLQHSGNPSTTLQQ